VSPRKHRRAPNGASGDEGERELNPSNETIEDGYRVRRITGSSSSKVYRCPGCDQEIRMGTPHVVAWVEEDAETRRHWHTPCWESRNRRAPRIERTRNAPRY